MIDLDPVAIPVERITSELEAARIRSLTLLDALPDAEQVRQHAPIMSPLVWDLAHVGNYEDQWLLRALGRAGVGERFDGVYDAFEHPRATRSTLPLLSPSDARGYIGEVRAQVLRALECTDPATTDPLLRGGYVYGMVIQHEHQHDETMLATLQLMDGDGYARYAPIATPPPLSAPPLLPADVLIEAGPFVMGTDDDAWAYDNERGAHVIDLPAFRIDAAPVTNAQFLEFIDDGGYEHARWWQPEGWAWRQQQRIEHPRFWHRDGDRSWNVVRFGLRASITPAEPVQHVSWYEADAFARWAGKRLPTEPEWEKASSWSPEGRKRRFPWGDEVPDGAHANVGQRHFGPSAAGAYASGASAYGVRQMIGDVWEWTASSFHPYPGFQAFPYREYSEVFFGSDYKVLRGGSWATHPSAIRCTFRNWDFPIRRQIFAGFRCARDV